MNCPYNPGLQHMVCPNYPTEGVANLGGYGILYYLNTQTCLEEGKHAMPRHQGSHNRRG